MVLEDDLSLKYLKLDTESERLLQKLLVNGDSFTKLIHDLALAYSNKDDGDSLAKCAIIVSENPALDIAQDLPSTLLALLIVWKEMLEIRNKIFERANSAN